VGPLGRGRYAPRWRCLIRRARSHPLDVSRMVSPSTVGRTRRRHAARPSVPRPWPRTVRTGPGASTISRSGRTRRGRSSSFGSRSSGSQAGRAAAEPRPDRAGPGALGGSRIHLGGPLARPPLPGRSGELAGVLLWPRGYPEALQASDQAVALDSRHPRAGGQGDDPPRAGDLAGARAVLRATPKKLSRPCSSPS
jgi:hypothetical protein